MSEFKDLFDMGIITVNELRNLFGLRSLCDNLAAMDPIDIENAKRKIDGIDYIDVKPKKVEIINDIKQIGGKSESPKRKIYKGDKSE